jgi:hypothetical protein
VSVSGLAECAFTLETGSADRRTNMHAFAAKALETFLDCLDKA